LTAPPDPVRGRSAFVELRRRGRRAHDPALRVHFAPSQDDGHTVLVSYAISRHVGGAVVRNLWRRRLRSIASEIAAELPSGAYLVALNPAVRSLSFAELRERVITTMRRASGESG
jgi:ribonuclease P protein component